MINENPSIDVFIFKNRFCTMGNQLISYKNFKDNFNINNTILGNYWGEQREKNIFKLENINVMGVHNHYEEFTDKPILTNIIGEFYHYVNFVEKERIFLMTEYVII
jgi:hypothetical protein